MVKGESKMSVSKLIGLLDLVEEYMGQHSFRDAKVFTHLINNQWDVVYYQSIIRDLNLTAVAVTRSIKLLTDRDLITLTMDTTDTRKKSVSLTDKGNAFKLHIIKLMGDTNENKTKL